MNVVILYDDVDARPASTPDERGVLASVDAVETALAKLGHAPARVPVGAEAGRWISALERAAPDVVFNLCEGVGGRSDQEPRVAAVVELLGIPMTGCPSETLALARRKDRVNALLARADIPVPAWEVTLGSGPLEWARWPAIVKPAGEDGSVGITQASVARDAGSLERALEAGSSYGALLVQEFVGEREVVVGIVGGEVLPMAEIDFGRLPEGLAPMVSYEAKWAEGSAEDRGTRPVCPADVPPAVRATAEELALRAWSLVGGRGYGRVDFRLVDGRDPYVLEVNPNPDLAPAAGLARMAGAAGWSYEELTARILREAVSNGRQR